MTIQEQLVEDMKTSMKAGTADRTGTLRLLRSSMKNEEIKLGHELTEAEALKVLQRESKQRRDSITQYVSADREDLAAHERDELEIVEAYLPQKMSEDELEAAVEAVIVEVGATSSAQMGAVIGAVMAHVGARADGGDVSRIVKAKLSA